MCADRIHLVDSLREANFKMPEKIHRCWLYFSLLLLLAVFFVISSLLESTSLASKTLLFNMPNKSRGIVLDARTAFVPTHSFTQVTRWNTPSENPPPFFGVWVTRTGMYAMEVKYTRTDTMWVGEETQHIVGGKLTHASAIKASRYCGIRHS